jgi:hypothetical protein
MESHKQQSGSVMTVAFELDGQKFTALNGGPVFVISCFRGDPFVKMPSTSSISGRAPVRSFALRISETARAAQSRGFC